MKYRLIFAFMLACLLPSMGCESEEKKTAFAKGMSGAVKLSQCLGVTVDSILQGTENTPDGSWADSGTPYPGAYKWFEDGILGDSSLTSLNSPARIALTSKLDCMGSAIDCDGVLTCAGLSSEPCESDLEPSCDGQLATTCVGLGYGAATADWGRKRTIDCANDVHGNGECGLITVESAEWNQDWDSESPSERYIYKERTVGNFCHAGVCDEGASTCEGDVLVSCVSTWTKEDDDSWAEVEEKKFRQRRFDCSRFGMVCDEGFSGAACRQPDVLFSCTRDYCEGSTLIACVDKVPSYAVNCGTFHPDFECVDRGSISGAECAVTTPKRTCDGESECINEKKLGICIGGVWITGSCGSFQSGVCNALEGGVSCIGPGMAGSPDDSLFGEGDVVPGGDGSSSCSGTQQICIIGGECIAKEYFCDGEPDCTYGEDEFDCASAGEGSAQDAEPVDETDDF